MTIHDKEAFADAQMMARIATMTNNDSFWSAAMKALATAYKRA